jgi:3-hydroxyisobutyrate dehydrogenase-like beta-hydroxyacid dehydrogenase
MLLNIEDPIRQRNDNGRDAMTRTVGMIGLGIMGGAMARNMAKGGIKVIGYDIDPHAREEARKAGVVIATTVAEVADKAVDILP